MFNEMMQTHFRACVLLAESSDPHRGRAVKLYEIPGRDDVVGVSDGVDAWVAAVATNPFSCDVARALQRLRSGDVPRRQRVTLTTPAPLLKLRPRHV